jgi:hypothetical protein
MRKTIFLLLLCTFLPLEAQTETSSSNKDAHFRRFMEWAHPTPKPTRGRKRTILPPYVMLETSSSSVFYNANLIAEENDPLPVQNESSIAVNPTNPLNLIASAVDYRNNSSTWVYISHDGGKTWENKMLGKPFPDWASSNDPSVGFDADGRGYFCYGGFNTQTRENGVFIAITEDEGKTWQAHIPVILHRGPQTRDSVFEDKYYVWLDNSPSSPYFKHAYIPWKRVTDADSATQIVLSKSTDGGLTWSVPVAVGERASGTSEDTTFGQSFPLAVTGPNGEVYVVWNYGPKHAISFARSLDGGKTFSTPRLIHTYKPLGTALKLDQGVRHTLKGRVRVETYPTLVCDLTNGSRRGWLYLCWAADSVPDVYFSRSADGGQTWSTPVVVHSNPANDQFWPWISIDPSNGDLAVMYLDSRDDPDNIGIHCYVSYSNDGGSTWIDRRVSDVQSDLRKNPFQGQAFAGDYSGNAFHNGIVYPSWFDTRNAGPSNTNNDVYTAVVNIRIPNPVENLTAGILPEKPTELQVQWQGPDKRAFGQPLLPEEITYVVYRNGQFVTALPFATPFLHDTGLTPYERYEYTVVVAVGPDTSVVRTAATYAGGARQPARPDLLQWAIPSGDYAAELSVKIPSVRADNVTPLVNARAIRIYRNGVFVKDVPINPTDTAKTLTIKDTTGTQGFYRYTVTIVDASTPANESPISNDLLTYTGPVAPELDETFDAAALPPYYNSGVWSLVTALGNRRTLTESSEGDYRRLANDTLILFPVHITEQTSAVQIEHAALIDPSDSAFVEISDDGMASWETIGSFTAANYGAWQDGTFDQNDFTTHTLPLPAVPDKTVFVRLRFTSGFSRNADGWYIDRLKIGNTSTSVEIPLEVEWSLHPNPASTYLMVSWPVNTGGFVTATVTDMPGRKHELPVEWSAAGAAVDIKKLVPGTYLLTLSQENGARYSRLFVVSR